GTSTGSWPRSSPTTRRAPWSGGTSRPPSSTGPARGPSRRGEKDDRILCGPRGAAVGRPPALPPQPGEPVAAPAERDDLPHGLRAPLQVPGGGGAPGLARGHDRAPGRPLLLRAEGLRRGEPHDPRAEGGGEGRLQPPTQGRAALHLGPLAGGALLRAHA